MAKAKPYSIAFGKVLKVERLKQSLSQEEIGFRCELDRTYVSGVERGVRNPTLQLAWVMVTKGLGLDFASFSKAVEARYRYDNGLPI